jgi:serine/threonine protein kinase/Tol biopolymer transport system component
MDPERWKQVDNVLQSALDRTPGERDAYLRHACAGDQALEREVRSLLNSQQQAGSFLERPALEVAARDLDSAPDSGGLPIGATVSHYRIVEKLGAGGMGVVYKAEDSRLQRFVALKFVSHEFARDPDALNRFRREARAASALNHPNICTLYDIAHDSGVDYLAMEYVEGKSLDKLITARRLPLAEGVGYATQIASALAAAHAAGIVHRDIKPGNVIVTPEGQIKILDFGLAKLTQRVLSSSHVETEKLSVTHAGTILGTVAYMSPEQASGRETDHRSDIFSLGIVLYEMVSGRKPFQGKSQVDLLHAIINDPPRPVGSIPPRLEEILEKALEKDPKERYQHAGDLSIDLKRVPRSPSSAASGADGRTAPSNRDRWLPWALAAAATLLLAALTVLGFAYFRQKPPAEQSLRYQISAPGRAEFPAFSPDGRYLAFVTNQGGPDQIWIRAMDTLEARPLTGTEGATFPFWSPDSAYLGFFANGKLQKIAVAGGPPQSVCDAASGRGGSWSRDGVILFSPGPAGRIFRVPAAGGVPTPVTRLAEGRSVGHRFPAFLPDGVHFLYNAGSNNPPDAGVFLGSLNGAAPVRLAPDVSNALYAPPARAGGNAHILFRHGDTLTALPFDAKSLKVTGDMFPVAEQVWLSAATGFGAFSVSESNLLAFRSGSTTPNRELVWINRTGNRVGVVGKPGAYEDLAISRDGKTVALLVNSGTRNDIWLQDVGRGVLSRFTFNAGFSGSPVWSPDGSRLIYAFEPEGAFAFDIYQKPIGGNSQQELLFHSVIGGGQDDWSPDGKWLVYREVGHETAHDLWLLPLTGDRKPVPYLVTRFDERSARFSPDGKWIAYESNESGRFEIYVQTFPASGVKYQISSLGGTDAQWRRDGKEVFYISADKKLMAVPVKLGPTLEAGAPQALFPVPETRTVLKSFAYEPSVDGQRFLVDVPAGGEVAASPPLTIVTNWQNALKK